MVMRAEASMKRPYLRDREYLPHLEIRGATYFVTLRLADTLPFALLQEMRMARLQFTGSLSNRKLNPIEEKRLKYLQTKRVQDYLDSASGACWLRQPVIAEVVQEAVRHHEGNKELSALRAQLEINHALTMRFKCRNSRAGKMPARLCEK
jgi:putative DNA methylase